MRINSTIYSFLLFLFLNFALNLYGGNSTKVLINTYNKLKIRNKIDKFESKDIRNSKGNFSEIIIKDYGQSKITGAPKLPVLYKIIEIPLNSKININILNITVKEYKLSELNIHHTIIPCQPSISKDTTKIKAEFQYNLLIYNSNTYFKSNEEIVTIEKLGIMRSENLARLAISPFEYNPVNNTIKVIEDIEFEISFSGGDIEQTELLKQINYSPAFTGMNKFIFNYKTTNNKALYSYYPIKYVIVSDPMFKETLKPFVEWKKQKGFDVIEAYTDDPTVGKDTASIRNYLKNLYNSSTLSNPAPSFILFVGDLQLIPSFYGTANTEVTDKYFTDLNYCDYTGDKLPEVYYGRFSANTLDELQPQIDKTIEYEKYQFTDASFLKESIMLAGYDKTYAALYCNGQINYGSDVYFNETNGFNNHRYLYPGSNSKSQEIIGLVNSGVGFINYTAHGSFDGFANPGFHTYDIPTLTNKSRYPLMIGNACYTNSYDKYTCFGEALLRAFDKGAIGYIGASSETYWDEDFWWSVGFGSIDTFPKYDNKTKGVYDLMFHSHKEPYNEWVITQGQIIQAGNIAVTVSGSSYYKFYWEEYNLMGDPSLMPYLAIPKKLNINYDTIQANLTKSIAFKTEAYTYIALSRNDTLLGTAFADSNGIATVKILNSLSETIINVVATNQNHIPYFGKIYYRQPEYAMIILNSLKINDSLWGNNNSRADYDERIAINICLLNSGKKSDESIKVKLRSSDKYIQITDSIKYIGLIKANDSIHVSNAFAIKVNKLIPDQHNAEIEILISDTLNNTWLAYFSLLLNSPSYSASEFIVDDAQSGNGNMRLDIGETARININTTNKGHFNSKHITASLTSDNTLIHIEDTTFNISSLSVDSSVIAEFSIRVDSIIPAGTNVKFKYTVNDDIYIYSKTFSEIAGKIYEDFESNGFSEFKWINKSQYPWLIIDSLSYDGKYCAKSGGIQQYGNSILSISFNVLEADTISFYQKTMSLLSNDYLKFYINEELKNQWSGFTEWHKEAFPLKIGYQTLKWSYNKYSTDIYQGDCAFLDFIDFPTSSDVIISTFNSENKKSFSFKVFPNPVKDYIDISLFTENTTNVNVIIYDHIFKEILTKNIESLTAGGNHIKLSSKKLNSGMYFVKIQVKDKTYISKIVIIAD